MTDINKECVACDQAFKAGDMVTRAEMVDLVKPNRAETSEFGRYAHLNCKGVK